MEEALHDTPMYRDFAGLDAGLARLPDETTILRFRHLLEPIIWPVRCWRRSTSCCVARA